MAGYTAPGNVMTFVAPGGGVTKGIFVIIGGTLVVPIVSALVGETFAGYVSGVHPGAKASGTTAAAGAACYYDSSSGLCEATDSATNRRIGVFAEAAVNGSTACSVRLDGVSFGAGNADLESKVDKVTGVNGKVPKFNASGNIESAGFDATAVLTDGTAFATAAQGALADTALQPTAGAVEDNLTSYGAAGAIEDSGIAKGLVSSALQPTAGAVEDNLTSYGAAGAIEDSGIAKTAIATAQGTADAALPKAGGTMTGSILHEVGAETDGNADNSITMNTQSGILTTQALATAAGASVGITWVSSEITAARPVFATVSGGTNTKCVVVTKVTRNAGSAVITLQNMETVNALDGTVEISVFVG